MKTITLITLTLFTLGYCQAQTIVDILDSRLAPETNYYLKDVNNNLDPFVGTWVYTDGNNSITIILKKKIHFQITYGNEYEDLIYGEYRFVKNGVEIINTLSLLNDTSITNYYNHNIFGNHFPTKTIFDDDPNVTGNIIKLIMSETKVSSTLEMYITTINGIQAIKACKRNIALFIKKGDPIPVTAMPFGELTFIKQ